MTTAGIDSDLVHRMRQHVSKCRSGATRSESNAEAWMTMMLEAASRLEAYETAIGNIADIIAAQEDEAVELFAANQADAREVARLQRLIAERDERRERLNEKTLGLRTALDELRDQMPAPTYADHRALSSSFSENDDIEAAGIIASRIAQWTAPPLGVEEDPELPLAGGVDNGDEWYREGAISTRTREKGPTQPDREGVAAVAAEGGAEGDAVPAQEPEPATATSD